MRSEESYREWCESSAIFGIEMKDTRSLDAQFFLIIKLTQPKITLTLKKVRVYVIMAC